MQLLLNLLLVPMVLAVLSAIVAVPTWLLWNWIAVSVFELPALSVLQTFGLLLLLSFLFGGKLTIER
jgi:hypothetical protein